MRHYVGIDLHCKNNFLVIIDEVDRIVFRQRLANGAVIFAVGRDQATEGFLGHTKKFQGPGEISLQANLPKGP